MHVLHESDECYNILQSAKKSSSTNTSTEKKQFPIPTIKSTFLVVFVPRHSKLQQVYKIDPICSKNHF